MKRITYLSLINLFCAFFGMGVPIFNILIGILIGVIYAKGLKGDVENKLRRIFNISLISSLILFVLMSLIWLPQLRILFTDFDVSNFGHPFFLYDPLISFYGFIVLMVIVSPFLQLLTILFGGIIKIIKVI